MKKKYRILIGINYRADGAPPVPNDPLELRREPGDVVDDIPSKSVDWLIECGAIELAGPADAASPAVPAVSAGTADVAGPAVAG